MADVLISPNSVEARLAVFLREVATRELRYGQHDCAMWLADWVGYMLGVDDPIAEYRGLYHDPESALAMLGKTPYPVLVARMARRAGLRGTSNPKTGAVAILQAGAEIVGGIKTPRGWALLCARGFIRVPDGLRVVGAWEVDAWSR